MAIKGRDITTYISHTDILFSLWLGKMNQRKLAFESPAMHCEKMSEIQLEGTLLTFLRASQEMGERSHWPSSSRHPLEKLKVRNLV
jgi:hypothetical protein